MTINKQDTLFSCLAMIMYINLQLQAFNFILQNK